MESVKVVYRVDWIDTRNFHGWIIWECSDGVESEYFKSSSLKEIIAAINDLRA